MPQALRVCSQNQLVRIDMMYHIVRQYDEKGHAVMGVKVMDNGKQSYFILPEEEATAA